MSKVQNILKLMLYQKQHPSATGREIASKIGITEQYIRKCRKDIKELSHYFLGTLLEKNEMDLLLSKLDPQDNHERIVLDKLRKVHLGDKDGKIEIAPPEDKLNNGYLQIALCEPEGTRTHMDFWLKYLLYDTLLHVDRDEKIEYRLAERCEPIEEYSKWRVKLKDDVYWSNGKPITCDDIEKTLANGNLSSEINEMKRDGKKEIIFTLAQNNPLFPYWLSRIPIFSSHFPDITNGPFLLRKGKSSTSFQIYRNKDYCIPNQPKIDWVKFEVFSRPSFAINAVLEKKVDIFPVRSLYETNQCSSIQPQSFPLNGLYYYSLLINRKGLLKSDNNISKFKESIDYNAINLCISGSLPQEHKAFSRSKISRSLKIGYCIDMPNTEMTTIINHINKCLGAQDPNLVDINSCSPETVKTEVDIFLAQTYFGYGYSRLRNYFHSNGKNNVFGFSYPEIDSLIDQLDTIASMKKRNEIGPEIIRKLQDENVIILLAPCFEYVLSNLYIMPSPKLNFLSDFIINLPNMNVQRGKFSL